MVLERRRGYLTISPELLLDVLNLEGRIVDIRMRHFEGDGIEILIEHPNLPICPEGGYAIPITLEDYQKKEDSNGKKEGEVSNLS